MSDAQLITTISILAGTVAFILWALVIISSTEDDDEQARKDRSR